MAVEHIVGWQLRLGNGTLAVFCHQCRARHLAEVVMQPVRASDDTLAARPCSQCGGGLKAGHVPLVHSTPKQVM